MACEKEPINHNDMIIKPFQLRCRKRKNHKGLCEMTYTISWYGVRRRNKYDTKNIQ